MAISYIVSERCRWSPEADRLDLLNLFGAPIKEHLNNGNYYIVALYLIVVSIVHDFSGFIGSSGLPPKPSISL